MDGVKEGFSDLGNAMRRILFGYDMNNPADKQAKENLEKVVKNDEKIGSGLIIGSPNVKENGLLIVGVIVFLIMIFKR